MNQHKKYTENEYAIMFQNGDERGLSFFYNDFYPALVFYSNRFVDNRSIAEEIASEAIVKTWRMHHKLDSYRAIKAYLYKVVYHDSSKAIQKNKNRRIDIKELQFTAINNDTPFDNLVRSETYRLLYKSLKDLPRGQRKVLEMYYYEGKSTGEIARELSLHKSTIKTQKQNALKALRKKLPLNMRVVHFLGSYLKRLYNPLLAQDFALKTAPN